MKSTLLLIFLLALNSCNTNVDKKIDLESYQKGIEILEAVEDQGKIDYLKALDFFNNSIRLNPNHIESKFWKMQCEIQLGEMDNALQTSVSVLHNLDNKEHKLTPHFYVTAGLVEKINGNIDSSLKYFDEAIQIYGIRIEKNINDTDAIMNKTIVLCYMDRKNDAVKFANSISLNEENEIILDQIRQQILNFDTNKVLTELMENKK